MLEVQDQIRTEESQIHIQSVNKTWSSKSGAAFLHFVVLLSLGTLVTTTMFIGSLSPETIDAINLQLATANFAELKISKQLVKDLSFPNPTTIALLLTTLGYLIYVGAQSMNPSTDHRALHALNTNIRSTDTEIQLNHYVFSNQLSKDKIKAKNNFSESSDISIIIHIVLLLLIILAALLTFKPRSAVQITEIEYIPTQIPSQKKPPPNTKRRAAKQSIDQGKHDPKQKITPVKDLPGKPVSSPAPKLQAKPEPVKPKPAAKPQPKASQSPTPQAEPASPKQQNTKPQTFEARKPVFRPLPKNSPQPIKQDSYFKSQAETQHRIPSPKTYGSTTSTSPSRSISTDSPRPKYRLGGSNQSQDLVAKLSSVPRMPHQGSGGNFGTPGNAAPNAYPNQPQSIAAVADIQMGPYMSRLERKIKMAWKPPKGYESNKIMVFFTINQQGQVEDLQLISKSRFAVANQEAINAIRRAAPFEPLPLGSGNNIDIEFTFDYNVFQKARY